MIKLAKVIIKKIWGALDTCTTDLAEGIERGIWQQVLLNIALIVLWAVGCAAGVLILLYLAMKYWWILLGGAMIVSGVKALFEKKDATVIDTTISDVAIELARQRALELQPLVLGFMWRVIIAVSSFTCIIRPRDEYAIEAPSSKSESFFMRDDVVTYQVEAEVEGEVTPEMEDILQRELQRYAVKYISDYPTLISSEAGGRAPVEILAVKNAGNRVLIDLAFTSKKTIPMIEARRHARAERKVRKERVERYIDEDYS